MMSRLFLTRLFKHSRLAGICVIAYILLYTILMSKGMFMQFFPSNGMFASLPEKPEALHTYGMFVNGGKVNYTQKPYWKKDLLEASLPMYLRVQDPAFQFPLQSFMEKYPATRSFNAQWIPVSITSWPGWYAQMAGIDNATEANIQVYMYTLEVTDGRMAVKDSQLVYLVKVIL